MEEKNTTRRKVLISMTSAVGAVGASFAVVPFIASWNPSAKAKAVGGPVKVDVSKMQVGQKHEMSLTEAYVYTSKVMTENSLADDAKIP